MKQCKGTGKAKGHGCNDPLAYSERNGLKSYKSKYGLGYDCKCFQNWLSNSDEGNSLISRTAIQAKKKVTTEKKKEDRIKKQELNPSSSMKSADTYFSRYIRLINSVDGICTCYTCGALKDIKETDNGHYQKREHKATRYHENNCRVQCKTCNGDTKHNGKQAEFRVHLANEIGEAMVCKVEALARTVLKVNTKFYKEKADHYRKMVNEIQKELKVKYW